MTVYESQAKIGELETFLLTGDQESGKISPSGSAGILPALLLSGSIDK
jgi:hypothetical protein